MIDDALPTIGGQPVIRLRCAAGEDGGPVFIAADIAPGRGMLLLQLHARLPGHGETELLATPPLSQVARLLDGGPDDFAGNRSFSLGGAILLPFANRIRGRALAGERTIATTVLGHTIVLPRNWSGKRPGAEQYAMHGLMLDRAATELERRPDRVRGRLHAGDFAGHWPSATDIQVEYVLREKALELTVEARNAGREPLPVGVGWHPYFRIVSGRRSQALLHVPGRGRAAVNDYDEVLPTGAVLPVSGSAYDFSQSDGRPLGELYLDDCFVDLIDDHGQTTAVLADPASRFGLAISAATPPVRAWQIYAPVEQPFVAIEPQYNYADPFGAQWRGRETGMIVLGPGESTTYAVTVRPIAWSPVTPRI